MNDSTTLPAPGTLYLCGDGIAYRLRSYRADLGAEPFTGERNLPSYSVLLVGGASTNESVLPDDAVLVWSPDPEVADA